MLFELDQIAHTANLGPGVDFAEKMKLVPQDEHSKKAADAIRKVLDEQG
jgi:hypothetical protein